MAVVKCHVKKGDTVVILSGKDKGKKGKVLAVYPRERRVLVEGVNIVKRHIRATREMMQGGIVSKEAPVSSANVMVCCHKCSRPVRVGRRALEDGTTVRYCKTCGEAIDK